MKKVTNFIGIPVNCYDGCKFTIAKEQGYSITIMDLVEDGMAIEEDIDHTFTYSLSSNLSNEEVEKVTDEDAFFCSKEEFLEFRKKSGTKYPTIYKFKVTVEAEPLSQEESEKFWRDKQSK